MSKYQVPLGTATTAEQLEAVENYAYSKYEQGWDEVVECMSKEDILKLIKGVKTCWGAIERVREYMAPRISHRKEIKATAW